MALGQENENPNRKFARNRPSLILLADRLTPGSWGRAPFMKPRLFSDFAEYQLFDQEGATWQGGLDRVLCMRAGHEDDAIIPRRWVDAARCYHPTSEQDIFIRVPQKMVFRPSLHYTQEFIIGISVYSCGIFCLDFERKPSFFIAPYYGFDALFLRDQPGLKHLKGS